MEQCSEFLGQWTTDPMDVKPIFERFRTVIENAEAASASFTARPGISYSLRAFGADAELPVVIMDVVDDDPESRWLSVCFQDALVKDPDELGDWVPEGLKGHDARCFDVESGDESLVDYVQARIVEAVSGAAA